MRSGWKYTDEYGWTWNPWDFDPIPAVDADEFEFSDIEDAEWGGPVIDANPVELDTSKAEDMQALLKAVQYESDQRGDTASHYSDISSQLQVEINTKSSDDLADVFAL